MNGFSDLTEEDIAQLDLNDADDSGGGGPCSFTLLDAGMPEAFSTMPEDTAVPASAHTEPLPTKPSSGIPSVADVFNINNFSGSDDGGLVPPSPASLTDVAMALCGGLSKRKSASPFAVQARAKTARKPSSLAATGPGEAKIAGFIGEMVAGDGPSQTAQGSAVGATAGSGAGDGADQTSPKIARKPLFLAASGLGGDKYALGRGGSVARRNPPRAAAASRKPTSLAELSSPSEFSRASMLSGDDTEGHSVHSSDGYVCDTDGSLASVIGSVDGEGHGMSDSDYCPPASDGAYDSATSSSSTSVSSSEDVMSSVSTGGSAISCHEEEDEVPTLDRPIGMMLAKAGSGAPGSDFVCSKVRQKYKMNVGGESCEEVFEVVFKDGKKAEYSRDEVVVYRENYEENQGTRGCVEFFFKV